MTVGLCNIDTLQLEVMSMSKDPVEQNIAKRILNVVSNHHLFLVTLLVYNAIALESLPLVVHTLMPDWLAIIFSTVIVLVAAEIVPQAICTGPKKITLAYYAAPVINVMAKLLCFAIYPMAKGLDWLLGTHDHHRIQHKDFAHFLTGNVKDIDMPRKY
jgi:metal transporter CNNM